MTDATTRQALRALLATLDDLPLDDLPAELAALLADLAAGPPGNDAISGP